MTVAVAAAGERRRTPEFSMLLAVLGVVYGDIGTSPLYAFKASLGIFGDIAITDVEVLGILSLIFWSLILIVTIKYVMLVMRADNRGEGGVLALMALAQRVCVTPRMKAFVALVGIAGACLFFGDGFITPAISVLSAIEGLEVSSPELEDVCAADQRGGDRLAVRRAIPRHRQRGAAVRSGHGGLVRGDRAARARPDPAASYVLLALSPSYAIELCIVYKALAFIVLGAVVLCVTGAEALYADMGHFGAHPIRVSWTFSCCRPWC